MASTLASQLQSLQKNRPSTLSSTVDPKALRKLHSVSLLFTPEHAATQDFDTIYSICYEGFEELCSLDRRFAVFERSLFSEQGVTVDRDTLSKADNEKLDENVKSFLGLLGAWALVKSGVKALEWLVRRFRVHYHNSSLLILTFLPYHQHPFFLRLLSILPQPLPDAFKFLTSYRKSIGTPIPRSVLIQSLTTRPVVFDLLAQHVTSIIKAGYGHATLARFWSALSVETLGAMLDRTATKSRTGITEDDVARQMLPIIADSLQAGKRMSEFQIGTYMLLSLLASRVVLEDSVLCATMESVAASWSAETVAPAIAALSLLSQQREGFAPVAPAGVAVAFLKVENVADKLLALGEKYRVDKLAVGLCLAVVETEKLWGFKSCSFVKAIFEKGRVTEGQKEAIMHSLIEAVLKTSGAEGPLKDLLGAFKENEVLIKVLKGRDDELERLELSLGMVLVEDPQGEMKSIEAAPESKSLDEEKLKAQEPKIQEKFDATITALPETTKEASFLQSVESTLYPLLCQALLAAAANKEKLVPGLFSHPVLASSTLRTTFIIRFSLDGFPVVAKEAALEVLKEDIKNADVADYQALLPYLMAILLDASQRVRRAAIICIAAIYAKYKSVDKKARKSTTPGVWAEKDIYGPSSEQVKWISFEELYKFVDAISSSGVEGCMLDSTQIIRSFATAVGSLKTAMKKSILAYIASHVLSAPQLHIKTALLSLINGVSGSTRTDLLLPLFVWWKKAVETKEVSGVAPVEIQKFQDQLINGVDVKDHGDGVNALVAVIKSSSTDPGKKEFASKASARLQKLWNDGLRAEVKPVLAMSLIKLIVGTRQPDLHDIVSSEALQILRNVTLTSEIYTAFINEVTPDHPADNLRSNARRKRSFSREVEARLPQHMKELTIVLELLEADLPERFPDLLPLMFTVLGRALEYAEAAPMGGDYMIQVLLSCLTAIVTGYKQQHPGQVLDTNSVRADLIVNCIRSTSSPQLQNSALLLIATLADTAPDVVLHSVMPIFTFMGANVLRQDDEYSAHVIEQTIHRVIPPLLESLRRGHVKDPEAGVSEIMSNFVAAFQHVPAHRRMKMYLSLSQSMGTNEYLYALLLLLGEKCYEEKMAGRHMAVTIAEFCENFCAGFPASEQMGAFVKYLEVCVDLAGGSPKKQTLQIFKEKQMSEAKRAEVVTALLELLSVILGSRKLKNLVSSAQKGAGEEVVVLKGCFVDAVKQCLQAGQWEGKVATGEVSSQYRELEGKTNCYTAAESCLKALLDLLPIPLFVTITGELVKDAASPYRTGILATFKSRITSETKKSSQDAALDFLPELACLLQDGSAPLNLRAEAVSCVTVITDKYGKEKQDAIASLLDTITGEQAFGSDDQGLQVLSILCLISMTKCLGGRIIPALPKIAPPALALLEKELEQETPIFLVHNAVCPLLEDLVKTIPNFMQSYLERMLKVSYQAALKELQLNEVSDDEDMDEDVAGHLATAPTVRAELLSAVAKRIAIKPLVKAVLGAWTTATECGVPALKQLFTLLAKAIELCPKSEFGPIQDMLFKVFLLSFDVRNLVLPLADEEGVREVEELMYKAMLQMVFKLNDKVFRPFFGRLLRFSSEVGGDNVEERKNRRLQTFYGFFNTFLEGLGSIVTNYYSHVLDNAIGFLESIKELAEAEQAGVEKLYSLVITSLTKSFANDQDEFWQSPTNFEKIQPVLMGQLELAHGGEEEENLPISTLVVQAVGELSMAAHTDDHDKIINSAVLKAMRSEDADVRLVAIKMMEELYERHKEEWIGLLPETMPAIAELMEDDVEEVEREVQKLIVKIEEYYGEKLETLLT
ncbi:snoRNA-binding rRNA-processing protein utp10 [Orbilia oligospora]|uniref:U3 small nucleolar RNA-associated protein 10 n=1 Tax=Orbilia oligospora TaxID=2813651 RepID=A0A7C8NN61_ORBOL|nr:snoRNA-binding rRNA-processing protein utp10 [Orbilia oligospora]